MNIEEIRSSGMLELYVLGRLDPSGTKLVEDAMTSDESLREEIAEIEKSLQYYAQAHGVVPSEGLRDKILQEITGAKNPRSKEQNSGSSRNRNWLSALLAICTLVLAFGLYKQNQRANKLDFDYQQLSDQCDSIQNATQNQIALLNELNDRNNDIIQVAPTDGFPQTDLYFHHNPISQRNFIQVKDLPPITNDQSYQLWSLKADQAPIPLDVFRVDGQLIIPVRHEVNTSTYAITIENRGGAQTPNLANLIGTFTVS